MSAIQPTSRPDIARRLLAGVSVPDTPLISRAIEYARERSGPYLFNHVMRSWLFAATLAQLNQTTHDGEVLAVTTILHDLGLAESFDGPLRFEVEGATRPSSRSRYHDNPYKVAFGQGDWTCALARFTVTTNDSMTGLDGNIIQPTNKKFEVDVCRVTHWKNRKIVEQRLFYDSVGMQKQIGVM